MRLHYLPQIPIILKFEKSSKWLDNVHAIQKIRETFFEIITSALMMADVGLPTVVHIKQLL